MINSFLSCFLSGFCSHHVSAFFASITPRHRSLRTVVIRLYSVSFFLSGVASICSIEVDMVYIVQDKYFDTEENIICYWDIFYNVVVGMLNLSVEKE